MDIEITGHGLWKNKYDDTPTIYKKIVGKSGRNWYIDTKHEYRSMLVSCDPRENAPGYSGFRGFGGRTLTLNLDDGTTVEETGPWSSNPDALFSDTGYDVRNKVLSIGVISKKMENTGAYSRVMMDVVYHDEHPVPGHFKRIEELAQDFADRLGQPMYYYSETYGGSTTFHVKPYWMTVAESKEIKEIAEEELKKQKN